MLVRVVGLAALAAAGLVVAYGMSSGPSYSDGPVPSVRDALSCDGRVYATRQVVKAEQAMWQPSPESALQSGVQQGEQWWLDPAEVRALVRTDSQVLFVHDVDGRARFAALVEHGSGEHVRDWRLSSWAMCEPSELTGDASDRLGYGVWLDADGDPVPTTEVMTLRGPEHCGWEDVTFLELDRDSTRDPAVRARPVGGARPAAPHDVRRPGVAACRRRRHRLAARRVRPLAPTARRCGVPRQPRRPDRRRSLAPGEADHRLRLIAVRTAAGAPRGRRTRSSAGGAGPCWRRRARRSRRRRTP